MKPFTLAGPRAAQREADRLMGKWHAGQQFPADRADEIFRRYPDLSLYLTVLRYTTFIHPRNPGDRFLVRNRVRSARAVRNGLPATRFETVFPRRSGPER